jgi:hypothetical protein
MIDARRLWTYYEPIHAVTYFAPQARAANEEAGLRGFWRGYFANRLAPMGPVGAAVATAALFGFSPSMVARGVPGIWTLVSPDEAIDARLAGADAALRTVWDVADPALSRAAALLRAALTAVEVAGRPLFAGNAALPWPDAPHLAVWHGCTLLREHRGDGHVAALVGAGLDGCEALVTHGAAGGPDRGALQPNRGWTDEEWQAAGDRLEARGWVEAGGLTAAGRAGRDQIEAATDRAAERALARLSAADRAELAELLAPLAAAVIGAGLLRYPNPIGVPAPS